MAPTRRSFLVLVASRIALLAVVALGAVLPSPARAAKTNSPMTGNVSGVVTLDGTTPLVGARITLIRSGAVNRKHTTWRTVSAEGGKFNIGMPAGEYVLRVFKEDVGQKEIKVEVKEHETTQVTISMKDDEKKGEKKKKDKKD